MNRPMNVEDLLDELRRRVMRLQSDGARVRSVGRLRELVQRAYNAGEMAGAAERLDAVVLRLSHALDEATANTPEPGLERGLLGVCTDPDVAKVIDELRQGRRVLWLAIEKLREQCKAEAERLRTDAHKRHMHVASRTDEALRPEEPLRQRAGRWLYALGVRISERGAA